MDKVFDFREFVLGFVKKFKLLFILALVFAILGGAFGYMRYPKNDIYFSSSTATISTIDKTQDSTALSNAMIMLNAYVTSDSFYTEMLNELAVTMDDKTLATLFDGDSTPNLQKVKEIVSVTTKGNIVIVGVSAADKILPQKTSELCADYVVGNVTKYNDALSAKKLGNEVVNLTKQQNSSALSNALKFAILGFGGGVILGILVIFFVDVFDLRVKSISSLNHFAPVHVGDTATSAAVVLNAIKALDHATLVLTSSSGAVDVLPTANALKKEFEQVLKQVNIISSPSAKSREQIEKLYAQNPGINLICCTSITKKSDPLHFISVADGVILCEQLKISRTDNISSALQIIKSLDTRTLALIIHE